MLSPRVTAPPSLVTDLAIHELSGARIEQRDGALVVRTPSNPHFHWGNCLWVTDPDAVDDVDRWLATYEREFPDQPWRAIGLCRPPTRTLWTGAGFELDVEESLRAAGAVPLRPLPDGYAARPITTDRQWLASIDFRLAEHASSGQPLSPADDAFIRAEAAGRRRLVERGAAAWFAAYDALGAEAAELGIVDCAGTARYQTILTDAAHRRRGLAGHLIGLAAGWAADRGCTSWVIVVHPTNSAARLYRSLGFEPAGQTATAHRRH